MTNDPADSDRTLPAEGGGDRDVDGSKPISGDDPTVMATPATEPAAGATTGTGPTAAPRIPDLEITEELGRGGMGVVYRGRQTYIDRPVAVKVLEIAGCSAPEQFVKRFQREAQLLARFDHPHIVKCYQAGVTADGRPYLVMEFVAGCTLRQRIEREGRLDQRTALLVARAVAEALDHAHQEGIIHRDVKPENVLLQLDAPAGELPFTVKLADLGLARPGQRTDGETSALTAQGMIMGTPATMAPEQFDDPDSVDFRCDIYGLGCVLYHSLTAEPAFVGKTFSQLLKNKVTAGVPDAARNPEVTRAVAAIASWCMDPDREHRPASYRGLIDRIDGVLSRMEGGTAPGGRGRGKAGLVLGAVALLAVVAIGVGIASGVGDGRDGEPIDPIRPDPAEPIPNEGEAEPDAVPDAAETGTIDPRDLVPGEPRPLWREDFQQRLADWTTGDGGAWGSHDEVEGAVVGTAFGPDATAAMARELPPPPWRIDAALQAIVTPGLALTKEAGVWLEAPGGRRVGVVVQPLGETARLVTLRVQAGPDAAVETVGEPRSLEAGPGIGVPVTLRLVGRRLVVDSALHELGETTLAAPERIRLTVTGGAAEFYQLDLATPEP